MTLFKTFIVIGVGALLSGCVSSSQYERAQEAMRGSPALKRDGIQRCVTNMRRASAQDRAQVAKIINVSPRSDVGRIYCTRAFNGIANGRITYSDFQSRNAKFIRVIQGR